MNLVPCHNCITLSICKATVSHIHLDEDIKRSDVYLTVVDLGRKCGLMHEYINPEDNYDYNIYQRRLAVHYLTGIDLGGDTEHSTWSMKEIYHKLHIPEEYNET